MAAVKILVAGDVEGNFDQLFARVAKVNSSHGPFSCVLCVGDFFGDVASAEASLAPYLNGEGTIPVTTYFMAGPDDSKPLPNFIESRYEGKEIAAGFHFLGTAGIQTLDGLSIAFASPASMAAAPEETTAKLATLRESTKKADFRGVDVFLSNVWPRGAFRLLDDGAISAELLPDRDLQEVGTEQIAELAALLRPRYHFCGGEGQAWQRAPYRLEGGHVCRLVALAKVQADKKQKWLHALSLVPLSQVTGSPLALPEGTTDNPYPYARVVPPPPPPPGGLPPAKKRRTDFLKDSRSWVAEKCWFCMSSPNFEGRLVASIHNEAYVCLAKGGLVPHHALVIPIVHKSHSLELSDDERAEMRQYVDAIRNMCNARGESLLLFERYVGNSQFEHMHLQAVPLPHALASRAKAAFERRGAPLGVAFETFPAGTPLSDKMQATEPFLHVELPSGEQLLHRLSSNPRKHPLQFGREVVAELLGKPDRADWKACMPRPTPGGPSSEELEQALTDSFKNAFAAFDPALVD